tara:strand:+ start:5959 stop:6756 length:798 start_codon:yes stop_codon:yes gene_type:complete
MKKLLITVGLTLLIAGCNFESNEAEVAEQVEQKQPFSEYLTCTPGINFTNDSVRSMITEWNALELDESLYFAAGHAPLSETSLGGSGKVYWQLFWESKEDANEAWTEGPSEEFLAWGEKFQDVLVCDGDGRRGYDVYWGRENDRSGDWEDESQWVTYAHYCKYTSLGDIEALGSSMVEFNKYLDDVESVDDGPFTFGVFLHNSDNKEPYINYDFFWMNYYQNHDDAMASYERYEQTGSEMQATFDEFSVCEGPFPSNSFRFLSVN